MKRTVLYLLAACAVVCAGYALTVSRQSAPADEPTAESLRQRVATIYDHIAKCYPDDPGPDADGNYHYVEVPEENLDSLYCTKNWNRLVAAVIDKDSRSEEDEVGFFEFDYWIMGQDWQRVHYDGIQVKDFQKDRATVTLNLYNFDNKHRVELAMCYEDGQWRIDDIQDIGIDETDENAWSNSLRTEMEAYLGE